MMIDKLTLFLLLTPALFAQTSATYSSGTQAPLKCGKYQHVDHFDGGCLAGPRHGDTVMDVCIQMPPTDVCVDDMHPVTEREWQELMKRLDALKASFTLEQPSQSPSDMSIIPDSLTGPGAAPNPASSHCIWEDGMCFIEGDWEDDSIWINGSYSDSDGVTQGGYAGPICKGSWDAATNSCKMDGLQSPDYMNYGCKKGTHREHRCTLPEGCPETDPSTWPCLKDGPQ